MSRNLASGDVVTCRSTLCASSTASECTALQRNGLHGPRLASSKLLFLPLWRHHETHCFNFCTHGLGGSVGDRMWNVAKPTRVKQSLRCHDDAAMPRPHGNEWKPQHTQRRHDHTTRCGVRSNDASMRLNDGLSGQKSNYL